MTTSPAAAQATPGSSPGTYTVKVNGRAYVVEVSEGGDVGAVSAAPVTAAAPVAVAGGEPVQAALAGNVFKVLVGPGQQVSEGDTILVLEAMKMETEVSAPHSGVIGEVSVSEGDSVQVGDVLLTIG